MRASDLVQKINNKEIKSGTHIRIHHTGSIKYTTDVWFHGNWFSKEPYTDNNYPKRYDDIILSLCDKDTDYEIVKYEDIPKHIPNEVIQDLDRGVCPANVKCIAHKVNELINYLQYKDKGDSDE